MAIPNKAKVMVCIAGGIGLAVISTFLLFESLWPTMPSSIIAQEALERVQALSEVQEFIAELKNNGKTASFNIEDRGEFWSVQVYEIVVQGKESHTATFNWYRVDKATGAVANEF